MLLNDMKSRFAESQGGGEEAYQLDADQSLSRATISFTGLRLPQQVMAVVEQADADHASGDYVAPQATSLLHGPAHSAARQCLRSRAARATAIAAAVKQRGLPAGGHVYRQCSVLDLATAPERFAQLSLRKRPEVLAALDEWSRFTSKVLTRLELVQQAAH